MNRTMLMLALALGLAACEASPGVDLVEAGGKLQVVFFNCSRPAQLLPVWEVEVRRISAGENAIPVCRLRTRRHSTLVASWRYGEPVDGYDMTGCGPLQPGEYQVNATMGPSGARAVVKLETNGQVTTRSGGCD